MTDTLDLTPSEAGYSVLFGSGVVMTEVEGGPSRFMVDNIRPSHKVQLQWATNAAGYDYLASFYERNVGRGFNIQLIIDDSGLETYKAFFEPQGFRLTRITGGTYEVSARLEVEFNDETEFQKAAAAIRNLYPMGLIPLYELVERLARICR